MQSVLGVNHGAVGIMPWDNPYDTPDIAQGAREIAPIFSSLSSPIVALLLDSNATRTLLTAENENTTNVDIARWIIPASGNETTVLVLMTSLLYENSTVEVHVKQDGLEGKDLTLVDSVFGSGEEADAVVEDGVLTITLGSTGIAGFVFSA